MNEGAPSGGPTRGRPRVLVVGAGHAGLAAVHGVLRRLPGARVVLIEPRSTHLLKPRLHEALAGSPSLELPLASLVVSPRVERIVAPADAVDPEAVEVEAAGRRHRGDFVVIASGARTKRPRNAKGRGWHTLDSLDDVRRLRIDLESRVERAASERRPSARRDRLSALVVGGGYTGVEASAEIALLLRRLAIRRGLSASEVHVTLCEQRERLFAGVPDEELARRVDEELARKGIDVRTGEAVAFDAKGASVGGHRSRARTVLLATGIEGVVPRMAAPSGGAGSGGAPNPLARSGRWLVDATLRVEGAPNAFAAGDAAVVQASEGAPPIAASAQHAIQEGTHVAQAIAARVAGRPLPDFRASTLGEFLTLGDGDVVGWIQVAGRRVHLSGLPAAAARAAAYARYLAQLRLGALVR